MTHVTKKGANIKKQNLDSSSEEEDDRVVKSGKDKRWEVLNGILKDLKNHIKINDFSQIMGDFDRLTDEIKRSAGVIFEDKKDSSLPSFLVRALFSIEECFNEVTAEKKKAFKKANSQAHNKLKQKFKKYTSTNGDDENTYEDQITRFRANPVDSDEERKKAKKAE